LLEWAPSNTALRTYISNKEKRPNLNQQFALFLEIHKIVNSRERLTRAVKEIIKDYMEENTIYLELRTTPRSLFSDNMSKMDYIQCIVNIIQEHNERFSHIMLVKLIITIDRGSRFKDAIDISAIASDLSFVSNTTEYPVHTIVGVDFGGNPHGGKFEDFSPLFDNLKDNELDVTIHTAQLPHLSDSADLQIDEDDTESILKFRLMSL
jgi:adenosine deaminase